MKEEGKKKKLFYYCIGNPPYQDETIGNNESFAPPVYHKFMDSACLIADKFELITPARFLFNAGSTPKLWNEKMLNNEHFKVLSYTPKSQDVFDNTDIKGGVAISYYDNTNKFDAIETFTSFPELNTILKKINPRTESNSLMSIIYNQIRFDLEALFKEHPEQKRGIGSDGKDSRFESNIFEKISIFTENKISEDDICSIGVIKNKRVYRYIPRRFVEMKHENLEKYKVLVPASNGSGALGEIMATPLIGEPLIGFTRTFIGIGSFETKLEAENAMKYIKTKFCRTALGILKITQSNKRNVWKYVPLQDFTNESDIDWSKSIKEIDQQLYKKYNLSEDEIKFIEEKVREME